MEIAQDLIGIVNGILGDSLTANIIKMILLAILGVGGIFISKWIKKKKIEAAQAETRMRRQDHQTQLDQETSNISQDAQNSEERIEEIINGR